MKFRHEFIEKNVTLLMALTFLVVAIGGLVEIVPLFTIETTIERVSGVRPYSPLELAGRDIYVREGCYLCHSQQIRPFRDEVERYGHYSLAAESLYDHPFQWGSKRIGPDLARVGGKYSNDWHVQHLTDPRSVVPESIMPSYAFLGEHQLKYDDIEQHLEANKAVGVPYDQAMLDNAKLDLLAQLDPMGDTSGLLKRYPGASIGSPTGNLSAPTELDALIAYLQVLGTMVKFGDVGVEELKQ